MIYDDLYRPPKNDYLRLFVFVCVNNKKKGNSGNPNSHYHDGIHDHHQYNHRYLLEGGGGDRVEAM